MGLAEYSRYRRIGIGAAAGLFAFMISGISAALERLTVPPGFNIAVYSSEVPNARQMALGGSGTIYIGTRGEGKVYAVVDQDGDAIADAVYTIAERLFMPSGVAYRDGTLYVAEINRIIAFDDIDRRLVDPPAPRVVYDALPSDKHHGWKFIDFGPDGALYIPVGAPCNVCEVSDPYGTIFKWDMDSKQTTVIARGVRNSVGFAWHPRTAAFWFSDNGRDWMGDDRPGCEINRVATAGAHFGFPYEHADGIADDTYGRPEDSPPLVRPAYTLDAHVAPLGMMFYTGDAFPDDYHQRLLVAEHGSWNRSKKSGYRVMSAVLNDAEKIVAYEPFVSGWLVGQANWGRPVDLLQLADGSVLISDDYAGVIYRVSYDP